MNSYYSNWREGMTLREAVDLGSQQLAQSAGTKFDNGKLRVDLLPYDSLMKIAEVYGFGAAKYNDENWRGGIQFKRIFGAVMRHMWKWFLGEDNDPESGLPHLAHAGFGILTLLNYSDTHPEMDDRPYKKLGV